MPGYWPSSFLEFCETKSRSVKMKKKEQSKYPATVTEQSSLIKDLLNGQKENFFFAGPTRVYPKRERWAHLDNSCSQSERRICFILSACGFSHIITSFNPFLAIRTN